MLEHLKSTAWKQSIKVASGCGQEILVICVCTAWMEILKGIAIRIKKNIVKIRKQDMAIDKALSFFSFYLTETWNPGDQKSLAN